MPVRVVLFFEDEDDGLGWSEVWYCGTSTIEQGLNSGADFAATRAKILSVDSSITYCRAVANLPADNGKRPRQTRNAGLQRLNIQGTAQAGGARSGDLPWTAIKVRWETADFSIFRTQLLRGLPDVWFDQGNDKIGMAAMAQWLPVALGVLNKNNMQIRHLNQLVPPALNRTYSYVAPARADYEGYTRRATGRPFGLPRGRRPNRT